MITVIPLGQAKTILGSKRIELRGSRRVYELLEELERRKVLDVDPIPTMTMLILINGVEVSALQGKETLLHEGDSVVLLPVAHGG